MMHVLIVIWGLFVGGSGSSEVFFDDYGTEGLSYSEVVTSVYERQLYLDRVSKSRVGKEKQDNGTLLQNTKGKQNTSTSLRNTEWKQNNSTLLHSAEWKNNSTSLRNTEWRENNSKLLQSPGFSRATPDQLLRASHSNDFLSFLSYPYDEALASLGYLPAEEQHLLEGNGSIKAILMLAELMNESSCTHSGPNGSVMCCTFSMEDSGISTICSNDSEAMTGQQVRDTMAGLCPELAWKSLLKWVCIPTLCAFGLCGNTISFLVLCSSSYRRKSYAHYLRALAIFDNLTLIINLVFTINDFMNSGGGDGGGGGGAEMVTNSSFAGVMFYHTTISCKITEFMRHVVYLMSSWLVVCFTVDRFIAVCFPLLRMRYCSERCATTSIIIVLVLVMASQAYHLVFIERLDRHPMPCHANPSMRLTYFGLNYFWFSFLLRFTLPFLAIALCNGCIIYHIARMRKGRWAKETRRKQKASLAIYTLYAVCACFVITVLPNAIVAIVQFASYFSNARAIDPKLYCTLRTVYTPLHILRLVNYSANFVLYGVAGRQFRRELWKLLLCCTGRQTPDKRSVLSPEPIALKADLILTSRKHGNTIIKVKQAEL